MTVSFMGTEASALNVIAAVDGHANTTYRTATSRASLGLGVNQNCYAEWPTAETEGWIHYYGVGLKDNDGSDLLVVVTDSSGNNLFRLYTPAGSTVAAQYWNGSAWTATGTAWASDGSLKEVAIHLVAGGSGSFEVYESGTLKDSGSCAFSGTDMKRVMFHMPDNDTAQYYSEVMLSDADLTLVTSTVETEAPTANGTDTDGVGSYTDVDEVTYSDADVISLDTAGKRNSFTSPARTATLHKVLGVGVAARMKRNVGGPQSAKFYLKIGGTRYYSGDFALTLGYMAYQYVWEVNPSTGLEWTTTDASAATLEWGIEGVA